MGVVRTVTDRVAVMYAGTVVEEALTGELFNNPRHPYTVALLECVPRLTGQIMAKGIPGTLPNYTDAPTGCRFHPRCPHAMPVCTQSRPPSFTPDGQGHRVACWLYDDR
jgi:peptide/nickel transport system ATP-binding protein